ncbi:MAG TPA: indolepyruvate ferredoxin oxidoreductase family protein [Rhizobiaceae bacterium]|nr:indolepyruvate ferredoxin oxidoreductase family protein [Rhizobiaceae bacterium]
MTQPSFASAEGLSHIREDTLADAFDRLEGPAYVTGMNALVRSVLTQSSRDREAGLTTGGYVTGYRGSPLGGVDFAMMRAKDRLEAAGVHFHPGLNEDLAATAIWGTQQVGLFEPAKVDGVFGVWYGKGPGVDRSGDPFKHGNLAGTNRKGGVVVLAGDDHTCKSSTTAHQSEPALIASGIPVLNPAGIEEIVPYFLLSVAMSRFSGCWVSLKCLTDTMDSSASLFPQRLELVEPVGFEMPPGGLNIRRSDTPAAQEARLVDWKLPAVRAFTAANGLDRITLSPPRKRLGIVTTGKSLLDTRAALSLLGLGDQRCLELGIGIYKVGLTWPLETDGARRFADGYEELIVVEEKRALVEEQLRVACYSMDAARRPEITGKADGAGRRLLSSHGELDPAEIAGALAARLTARGILAQSPPLPIPPLDVPVVVAEKRSPWFCAGCPHNVSTRVPEGSLAGAGIGCHALAAFNDPETTLPFTQMGGEGANWIGRARFVENQHVFQNLGDGTYNHSGLLAVRAAIGAGVNITYKILFNDAVAMTGGQAHDGSLSVPQIVGQLLAEGVQQVAVVAEQPERHQGQSFPAGVDIVHRDELDAIQRRMRDIEGVTAIIYDQACATERRRRRKRGLEPKPNVTVHINDLVCEGCGDCGAVSNCVAIQPMETPLGTKRRIDQSTCNVDQSCLKGFCPSFVTVEEVAAPAAKPRMTTPVPPVLPEPQRAASLPWPYGIVITGIGGTGVVTVSALLGMAAHLDRLQCRVVDQTGMAQKNGGVKSHVLVSEPAAGVLPARVPPAGASLLLGCDLLGAAMPETLGLVRSGAASAVINANVTTTGRFTRIRDLDLGVDLNKYVLEKALGPQAVAYVDAAALATELFGDATSANMIMLGNAWQRGLIPISFAALDRAIELNGVAVSTNRAAFAWGRAAAEGISPPRRDAPAAVQAVTDSSVGDFSTDYGRRLEAYQNLAYARRFGTFMQKVAQLERERLGSAGALTRAVAASLYKLMAYKDEYEVARLLSDEAQLARIRSRHGEAARLSFHLAPPLFARVDPRTGHPAKMRFGPWVLPIFRLLARAKGLRGTAFDPFGHTRERRAERRAIEHYMETIEGGLAVLAPHNAALIEELARLPMDIRGFGHVKGKARQAVAEKERQLLVRLKSPADRQAVEPAE